MIIIILNEQRNILFFQDTINTNSNIKTYQELLNNIKLQSINSNKFNEKINNLFTHNIPCNDFFTQNNRYYIISCYYYKICDISYVLCIIDSAIISESKSATDILNNINIFFNLPFFINKIDTNNICYISESLNKLFIKNNITLLNLSYMSHNQIAIYDIYTINIVNEDINYFNNTIETTNIQSYFHDLNNELTILSIILDEIDYSMRNKEALKVKTLFLQTRTSYDNIKFLCNKISNVNDNSKIIKKDELHIVYLPLEINNIISQLRQLYIVNMQNINIFSDINIILYINKYLFYQLISNLVVNAAEAMSTQTGNIDIILKLISLNELQKLINIKYKTTDIAEMFLNISIADQGIGIDKSKINTVLNPFITSKNSNKHGLGLTIVKNIVTSYDGYISIKDNIASERGGTIFNIYLPLPTKKKLEDLLVIINEDDDSIRDYIYNLLQSENINCLKFSNSEHLLKYINDTNIAIDCIITDIMMQGMNGSDLIKIIKSKPIYSKVKAIIISGFNKNIIYNEQFDDIKFIHKPFSKEILLDTLAKLLNITL